MYIVFIWLTNHPSSDDNIKFCMFVASNNLFKSGVFTRIHPISDLYYALLAIKFIH